MQRPEGDGIIISCDFCGTDWDEQLPMIEGHRGSVLCLDCLKRALVEAQPADSAFTGTLCLRDNIPAATPCWRHPSPGPNANPDGILCEDCMKQAARAFHRDPDVDWTWQK